MRYLLLSVLVVCVIGVMVPSVFAANITIGGEKGRVDIHENDWTGFNKKCAVENTCFDGYLTKTYVEKPVIFYNGDDIDHSIVSDSPDFKNIGLIKPGEKKILFIYEEGEYDYYCEIHPWMKGILIAEIDKRVFGEDSGFTLSSPNIMQEGGIQYESCGTLPNGQPCWHETDQSYNQRVIQPMIYTLVLTIIIIGVIVSIIVVVIKRKRSKTPKPSKRKMTKEKETLEFCIQCGTELKPEAKFCAKCGTARS